MTAFSDMLVDLFENPDMAEDAVYQPSEGDPITLRALRKKSDTISSFSDSKFLTQTTFLQIRAADVADPKKGDQITIGTSTFTVQAKPEREADGLIWSLNVIEGA